MKQKIKTLILYFGNKAKLGLKNNSNVISIAYIHEVI